MRGVMSDNKLTLAYIQSSGINLHQVEASLARLDTDHIDVLQIHRYDPSTSLEETVRYLGASSMWATKFANLQHIAEKHGWTKFISMQNYYNICYREEEREMNRFCKETGVGIIPWPPLFGGLLARPVGVKESIRSQTPSPSGSAFTAADEVVIKRVEQLANEKGWKMVHVALVWLRSKGAVPIVGATSVEKLDDVVEIGAKTLTGKEIKFLEEPYDPKPIAGHF